MVVRARLLHSGLCACVRVCLCACVGRCSCSVAWHDMGGCCVVLVSFHPVSEIVFAVPNDARTEVLNPLGGTIAIVERGEVPFATKVRHAQAVRVLASACKCWGTCWWWEAGRGNVGNSTQHVLCSTPICRSFREPSRLVPMQSLSLTMAPAVKISCAVAGLGASQRVPWRDVTRPRHGKASTFPLCSSHDDRVTD